MNRTVCQIMLAASVAWAGIASAAEWPKQDYVPIKDTPDSALCRETTRAVAELRDEIGWPMTRLYGQGEGQPDRTVAQLTFQGLRVQSIEFVNSAGKKRILPLTFYRVDIDNSPPLDMIDFVTGGHLAAGDGTTLTVLGNDLSIARQPIPDRELRNAALVIGPLEVSFRGKDFDAGYYIYPFAFAGRNYLFIEGNGERHGDGDRNDSKDAVIELGLGVGIVPRCYFTRKSK
jgi:hypothetical protein